MSWPPRVGEALPRAAECWYEEAKLAWVLSEGGHGPEWERVFRVGPDDAGRVWAAIAGAMASATITEVRDRSPFGLVCGVRAELTVGERSATVTSSWHYEDEGSAPRLATAYPSL